MTTYVLGAGASYHAGYPLTGDLGEELFEWISHNLSEGNLWRNYLEELHKLYDTFEDIESILTELDECPPGSRAATLIGRMNIRAAVKVCIPEFFNSLRKAHALHYDQLARERILPGDVIITFNYDLACERSLKNAGLWEIGDGYGFRIPLDAIPPSKVKVLKLHGSTNWWEPLFGGMRGFFQSGPNALPYRPVILFPHDFEFLSYPRDLSDPLCDRDSNPGILPAIITPARNKRFYERTSSGGRELEGFWGDIWVQAKHALRSSEKIVIIGYSMPAADEAARTLILNTPIKDASVTICSGSRSAEIRDEFASNGFTQLKIFRRGLFEEFLSS